MTLAEVFRRNLAAAMAHDPEHGKQLRLARASHVGQTTISRVLRGEQVPSLDVVEALARALGLEPWQLLVEGFEPTNPPITRQDDGRLRELYARINAAMEELAAYRSTQR